MKKINKKIITVILVCAAVIAIIALAACGSKNETEEPANQTPVTEEAVQTTEKKKDDTVETIDLKTDKGELKYIEYLPFPNDATTYTPAEGKETVVFCFEFINLSDDENSASGSFSVKCYQNGVELEDLGAYMVTEDPAVKALSNRSTSLLNGGKVTVGYSAILADKSPVTVIAQPFGFSDEVEKQKMIVSFDEKEDKAKENKSDETTKAATEAKKTIELKKDEKIKTDDFDFTLKNVELTYEVMPSDTSSVYSSYINMYIYNNGISKMRIYSSGAHLTNPGYSSHNSTLKLCEYDTYEEEYITKSYIDIPANSGKWITWYASGSSPWYYSDSYIYFNFKYDTIDYTSYYSDYEWHWESED